jgi:hypothetical protein
MRMRLIRSLHLCRGSITSCLTTHITQGHSPKPVIRIPLIRHLHFIITFKEELNDCGSFQNLDACAQTDSVKLKKITHSTVLDDRVSPLILGYTNSRK